MMARSLLIRWTLLLVFCVPFIAQALTPHELPIPTNGQTVVDYADVLSDADEHYLNQIIQTHQKNFGDEIAVVILPSLADTANATPMPSKDFAIELFNHWRIGQAFRNNGLLILLVLDQRRVEFITGYGLEGVLPDVVCWKIQQNNMLAPLSEGDYAGALSAGLHKTIELLQQYPESRSAQTPSYSTSQIIGMGLNAPFNNAEPLYLQEGKQTYVFNAMRLLAYWLISQPLWFALIWLKERNRHLLLRQQALAHLRTKGSWLYALLTTWLPLGMAVYSFFLTDGFWSWVQQCLLILVAVIGILAIYTLFTTRRSRGLLTFGSAVGDHQRHQEYAATEAWRYISMFFLCPLALPLYERWYRPHLLKLRVAPKGCAHCHNTLQRVPYEQAHTLLSQRQKAEEEHRFADYDVWSCPHCQHTEVLSYTPLNKNHASLSTCDQCHEPTRFLLRTSTTRVSTPEIAGEAQAFYQCLNCHHLSSTVIALPLLPMPDKPRDDDSRNWDNDDDAGKTRPNTPSSQQDDHDFGGGSTGGGGAGSNW